MPIRSEVGTIQYSIAKFGGISYTSIYMYIAKTINSYYMYMYIVVLLYVHNEQVKLYSFNNYVHYPTVNAIMSKWQLSLSSSTIQKSKSLIALPFEDG